VFGLGRAAGSQLWGSWTLSSRTAVDGGKMEWNEMGERERAVMSRMEEKVGGGQCSTGPNVSRGDGLP
jgi:hypothetical protein